jgi:hypothetical protein
MSTLAWAVKNESDRQNPDEHLAQVALFFDEMQATGAFILPNMEYTADWLLRGFERYYPSKVLRRTGGLGSTDNNPYEGWGWLAYAPEYEKLNNRLRAVYNDTRESLVEVRFKNNDKGVRGFTKAKLENSIVTLEYQKLPWGVHFVMWRKPKSHTPYSLDTNSRSFNSPLTPYDGYPRNASYPLGGKQTLPFSTLLIGLGSCEYELSRYTFFVRMYGYSFHRGDDYNTVYQTTGLGNFTKIEHVGNPDPCYEKGTTLTESNMMKTLEVEIDRSHVGPGLPPPPLSPIFWSSNFPETVSKSSSYRHHRRIRAAS